MLADCHRLKKSQDFGRVYQQGIRRHRDALSLRAYRPSFWSEEPHPTRIGISISQKVSKRAVIRNRIKRQIRAACSKLLPDLSPSWDIVIVVRPPAVQCDYRQILQQLKQLMAEAEILNGHTRGSLL
ncbi:ribonuclease P protein component [Synechococcales cyanobacterium C]|uniref:Ribonuclease P protein component n=1 Tax=Petrachloros mirabilis ULC683 TaxID=2781853 RepID=A0A8K2A7H0_9CYAN|nr:ribonuclease P protein component [Petrachloros mirabilis ULC683]